METAPFNVGVLFRGSLWRNLISQHWRSTRWKGTASQPLRRNNFNLILQRVDGYTLPRSPGNHLENISLTHYPRIGGARQDRQPRRTRVRGNACPPTVWGGDLEDCENQRSGNEHRISANGNDDANTNVRIYKYLRISISRNVYICMYIYICVCTSFVV